MPFAIGNDARLYWKLDGGAERPALVLLNSIGTDLSLWDACVPHLLPAFRLLRMDMRGHGASDATDGNYSLAMLAADVLAVMDAAGVDRAAVAGVSLGGMVAMEMALARPDRVEALALICTSAAMDRGAWADRVAAVRAEGMAAIADPVMARFLSPTFTRANPAVAAGLRRALLTMDACGYAGAGAAIRDMDLIARLPTIGARTLVVAGDRDVSTPFEPHGAAVAAAIAGAAVVHVDGAHLLPVEAPAALAAALRRFLTAAGDVDAARETLFQAGLDHRRRVLGDAWVERSLANRTPFTADFQAMITRTAWQEVWSRPGLDDRTRRLIVLAVTASLGRWEEFALHVRAGLSQGGFTQDELKELLMQLAVYAGVPAANSAFAEAERIIADITTTDSVAG